MAIALFPATFAPRGAGVFAAGVAHAPGLAVGLQAQLPTAGWAACLTLLHRLVASRNLIGRDGIRRHVAIGRCVQGTRGARRAQRIDAQASSGRLARCFTDLTANANAEIVRTTGLTARRVRACGRPVAFVDQAGRTESSPWAPSGSCVAQRSQPIAVHAARYGQRRRGNRQQKTWTKQFSHDSTPDEDSATSRHGLNRPDSKGPRQGSSRFCEPSELPASCRPDRRTTRCLGCRGSRRTPSAATRASTSRPRVHPSRRSHASRCWPRHRASRCPWRRRRPRR